MLVCVLSSSSCSIFLMQHAVLCWGLVVWGRGGASPGLLVLVFFLFFSGPCRMQEPMMGLLPRKQRQGLFCLHSHPVFLPIHSYRRNRVTLSLFQSVLLLWSVCLPVCLPHSNHHNTTLSSKVTVPPAPDPHAPCSLTAALRESDGHAQPSLSWKKYYSNLNAIRPRPSCLC